MSNPGAARRVLEVLAKNPGRLTPEELVQKLAKEIPPGQVESTIRELRAAGRVKMDVHWKLSPIQA